LKNSVLKYDPQLATPVPISGAITEGLLYGVDNTGKMVIANALHGAIVPAVGVALKSLSAGDATAGRVGALLTQGKINFDATEIDGGALTPGQPVYLSIAIPGGVTSTRQTGVGDLIQPIGMALTTTQVWLNVIPPALKAQAAGNSNVGGV
jgi:hypothetical protein